MADYEYDNDGADFAAGLGSDPDFGDHLEALDDEARRNLKRVVEPKTEYRLPKVGRFIAINSLDWASYKDAVLTAELTFNPAEHEWFDALIAEKSGLPALQDPYNPEYAEYEPLRNNLATIRNHLLNQFFSDGRFDGNDSHDRRKLDDAYYIAEQLGEMIERGAKPFNLNPFKPSINFKLANTEGFGAKAFYEKIYDMQHVSEETSLWKDVKSFLGATMFITSGKEERDWNLAHVSRTPFHVREHNHTAGNNDRAGYGADLRSTASTIPLAAAAAAALSDEELAEQHTIEQLSHFAGGLNQTANDIVHMAEYRSVDSLEPAVKERAIDEARKILKGIKMHYADVPVEELLEASPDNFSSLVNDKYHVVATFYDNLHEATTKLGDDVRHMEEVQNAENAVYKLAAQTKLYAMQTAEQAGNMELAGQIKAELAGFSDDMLRPPEQSVAQLFSQIERGIDVVLSRLNAVQHDGAEETTQRAIDPTMLSQSQYNRDLRDEVNNALPQTAANDPQYDMQQAQAAHTIRQQQQQPAANDPQYAQQQQQQQPVQQQQAQAIGGIQPARNNVTKQPKQSDAARHTQQKQQQNFNKMLGGADLASMRGSLNKKTSGSFDAGAPTSAAKVVADQVRQGQRTEKKAIKQEKKTQKREARTQKVEAQRQQAEQKQALPNNKNKGTGIG